MGLRRSETRVVIVYQRQRLVLDVKQGELVRDVKEKVRVAFQLGPDEKPGSDKRMILSLTYGGGALSDSWYLTDIGIPMGSTLKVVKHEVAQPSVRLYCSYNNATLLVYDPINFGRHTGAHLRSIASRRCGLPVGAFLLVTMKSSRDVARTPSRYEVMTSRGSHVIYDCNRLDSYGLDVGATVEVRVLNGWNNFVTSSIAGNTNDVIECMSNDELIAHYQAKVALYVAAHYGHVNLASAMLHRGARADDPVAEHPAREWCVDTVRHVDSWKCAVHEAAENGQTAVLRLFLSRDVTAMCARDSAGATPLSLAVQNHHRLCIALLFSKHFTKIPYGDCQTLPLLIYASMKRWAKRAKEVVAHRASTIGLSRTSPGKLSPRFVKALVGHGVWLDGYNYLSSSSSSTSPSFSSSSSSSTSLLPHTSVPEPTAKTSPRLSILARQNVRRDNVSDTKPDWSMRSTVFESGTRKNGRTLPTITETLDSERIIIKGRESEDKLKNRKLDQMEKQQVQRVPGRITDKYPKATSALTPAIEIWESEKDTKDRKRRKGEIWNAYDNKNKKQQRRRCEENLRLPPLGSGSSNISRVENGSLITTLYREALVAYEKHIGRQSRDHAERCMEVAATCFRESGRLLQVRRAIDLVARGVRLPGRAARRQYLFSVDKAPRSAELNAVEMKT